MIEAPSGSSSDGLYVDGSMWVTGAKVGYVTDAALNDGSEPLETGDVVVITGAAAPLAGETPVIRVRKATAADGTAVVGVVDQGVVMQRGPQDEAAVPGIAGHEAHLADGTAIRSGEYLLIVTMGAYKGVKVDATLAPIERATCWSPPAAAAMPATPPPPPRRCEHRDRQGARRSEQRHRPGARDGHTEIGAAGENANSPADYARGGRVADGFRGISLGRARNHRAGRAVRRSVRIDAATAGGDTTHRLPSGGCRYGRR